MLPLVTAEQALEIIEIIELVYTSIIENKGCKIIKFKSFRMFDNLKRVLIFLLMVCLGSSANGQILNRSWKNLVFKSKAEWYASDEAVKIAENVLLYQRDIGGWPKNIQMHHELDPDQSSELKKEKSKGIGSTIDNDATTLEMFFLASLYAEHPDERYEIAFNEGLDYLLQAQYESGGWPQFYPLRKGYYSHITYNDNAMFNVLQLLHEVLQNKPPYNRIHLSREKKGKLAAAFQKGINCILKTQYVKDGKLTGWCAQHDRANFMPAKARSYELPSLSGMESASLAHFLMDIEKPTPRIVKAIEAVVQWFKDSKLTNTKVIRTYNDKGKVVSKEVIKEDNSPSLWGRFMELEDNSPFFCDRDGIKKKELSEIGSERQLGYRWYTDIPQQVIKRYPKWKERILSQSENPEADLYSMIVAQDGTGHFGTISDALLSAKSFPYERVTIFVKNGIYQEKVSVNAWNSKISLVGENKDSTIIRYGDYFEKIGMGRNSTFYTATLRIEGDDFHAKDLTIENSAGEGKGQAIALMVAANRVKVENCKIVGNQDTVFLTGESSKQYFKDCHIEGTTDFIFGNATALFENCVLMSKKKSYITAASTTSNQEFGFVFKNCELSAIDDLDKVYLGRTWRKFAKTVFIQCNMGGHIIPEGWDNWSNIEAKKTSFYAEFNSKGKGANVEARIPWSHQLGIKEVKKYSRENILGQATQGEWWK